jgi:hypothetical protein
MKTLTATFVFVFFLSCSSNAKGQVPGIQDLTQNINEATSQISQPAESPFGFKKLQMPKSLDGLLDVRFKKPQLPNFGLLDKLKGIGKPQLNMGEPASTGPILSGLAKLFPPKQKSGGSFLDKVLGKSGLANQQSLFSQHDMGELSQATKGLSKHVGRMSKDVRNSATQLFNGQAIGSGTANSSLQPPLRSARQYSEQTQSRF